MTDVSITVNSNLGSVTVHRELLVRVFGEDERRVIREMLQDTLNAVLASYGIEAHP